MIGASLGLAARAAGFRVAGWDEWPEHAAVALETGALDGRAASLEELLAGCDWLAIALPLDATVALLERLAASPPPARLVIDVASLKVPVRAAASSLPSFVGTHPIAGSERSGPAAASAGLFVGRVWTYEAGAPEPARSAAIELIAATGARPVAVEAGEHDRALALTSHLPQLVSIALAARLGEAWEGRDAGALCGPGMASMTRLAASPWSMWRPILEQNEPAVAQEVRALISILSEAAEALEAGRVESLEALFELAAATASRLPK